MTLNGVMAVTLRYFTEFGTLVFRHRHTGNRVDLWRNLAMHESIVFCSACKYVVVKNVHVRYLIS